MLFESGALVVIFLPAFYYGSTIASEGIKNCLLIGICASILCFFFTYVMIPTANEYLLNPKRNLWGNDLGKKGSPAGEVKIPSGLGLVCGTIFMVTIIVEQFFFAWLLDWKDSKMLLLYSSALTSICFMVLLGFADDVLDLPWRAKIALPIFGSLPLLVAYWSHGGSTQMLVPPALRWLFIQDSSSGNFAGGGAGGGVGALTWGGSAVNIIFAVSGSGAPGTGALVELGFLFYVYMCLLAIFCTNTINIYAGLNGLEAGQSLIIVASILCANTYDLAHSALVDGQDVYSDPKLFSALLAQPFLATTLALLAFNLYPAKVFVGDTYCYFAGMTIACMAILGQFSKTLLLFCIPQIINFCMSLPQLLKIYECPRHRMPGFDVARDVLVPSTFVLRRNADGTEVTRPNLTLINAALVLFGPMHERTTVNILLIFQIICCAFGLFLTRSLVPTLSQI